MMARSIGVSTLQRPARKAVTIRLNLSLYLMLTGLILAICLLNIANGSKQVGPFLYLADSYIGIYRVAGAIKLPTGEYISAAGEPLATENFLDFLRLLGKEELTSRQPVVCIVEAIARGCNLPFFEASLGQSLALPAALFMLAVLVVCWGQRHLSAMAAGWTVCLVGGLLLVGSANGLQSVTTVQNINAARVGVYRSANMPTMLEQRTLSVNDLLWALGRKGAVVFRQAHNCYTATSGVCHQIVVELPLGIALGVLTLSAVVTELALWIVHGKLGKVVPIWRELAPRPTSRNRTLQRNC